MEEVKWDGKKYHLDITVDSQSLQIRKIYVECREQRNFIS